MDWSIGQQTGPLRTKHSHAIKRHSCTWPGCLVMFSCPHNVRQHVREAHTFERPWSCKICGPEKAFTRPYTLNRHMKDVHGMQVGPGRGGLKRKRGADMLTATDLNNEDAEAETDEAATPVTPKWTIGHGYGNGTPITPSNASRGVPQATAPKNARFHQGQTPITPTTATGYFTHVFHASEHDAQPAFECISGKWCRPCQMSLKSRLDFAKHNHLFHRTPCQENCGCELCAAYYGHPMPSQTNDQDNRTSTCIRSCLSCPEKFFPGNEAYIVHLHEVHHVPSSSGCPCRVCRALYRSNGGNMVPMAAGQAIGSFTGMPTPPTINPSLASGATNEQHPMGSVRNTDRNGREIGNPGTEWAMVSTSSAQVNQPAAANGDVDKLSLQPSATDGRAQINHSTAQNDLPPPSSIYATTASDNMPLLSSAYSPEDQPDLQPPSSVYDPATRGYLAYANKDGWLHGTLKAEPDWSSIFGSFGNEDGVGSP